MFKMNMALSDIRDAFYNNKSGVEDKVENYHS